MSTRARRSSSSSIRCARGRTRRRCGSAASASCGRSTSAGGSSRSRRSTAPTASATRGSGRSPTAGRRCASPRWLRRIDNELCGAWYEACGQRAARRRPPVLRRRRRAASCSPTIGAPADTWERRWPTRPRTTTSAPTTTRRSRATAAFGVPIIVFPTGRGRVRAGRRAGAEGDEALALWDLTEAYSRIQGLYELKTPKTADDLRTIADGVRAVPRRPRVADDPEPGAVAPAPAGAAMPIPHDTIDKLEQTFRADQRARRRPRPRSSGSRRRTCPAGPCRTTCRTSSAPSAALQGLPARRAHERARVDAREEPDRRSSTSARSTPGARRSGAEVLAEWDELTDAAARARCARADEAYFDAPTQTPTGPGTVADFLHIRVLDCWSHEQDMRRAVGAPGGFDSAERGAHDRPADPHAADRGRQASRHARGRRGADRASPARSSARSCYEVRDGRAQQVDAPTAPTARDGARSTARRSRCSRSAGGSASDAGDRIDDRRRSRARRAGRRPARHDDLSPGTALRSGGMSARG